MFDQKTIDRFWARVDTSPGDAGCWFPRSYLSHPKTDHMYRYASVFDTADGSLVMHKFAYLITRGPVPDGLVVRHRCGYGACCNPRHLMLGTQRENMWDWHAREFAGIGPDVLATYEDIPEWVPPSLRKRK